MNYDEELATVYLRTLESKLVYCTDIHLYIHQLKFMSCYNNIINPTIIIR